MAQNSMGNVAPEPELELGAVSASPEGYGEGDESAEPPPAREPHPHAWFIDVVDSRFLEYDKPMMLACIVGGITLTLGVIIFMLQLTTELFDIESSSASVTYPQYYGGFEMQRAWYTRVTGTPVTQTTSTAETTVTTELCIMAISVNVPNTDSTNNAMRFWKNVAGSLGVPFTEYCWPDAKFRNGNTMNYNQEPAVWNSDPGTQAAISICPGFAETWRVKAEVPDGSGGTNSMERTGETAILNLANTPIDAAQPNLGNYYDEVMCPMTTNANGQVPWIIEYKQTVTTKSKMSPSPAEAVGTAMAYTAYIQVVITLVLVNSMLFCKCLIHETGEGIDDLEVLANHEFTKKMGNKAKGMAKNKILGR